MFRLLAFVAIVAALFAVPACTSKPVGPGDNVDEPPGSLRVVTATTGGGADPDGYSVSLNGGPGAPIGANDATLFTTVEAGPHIVELLEVAATCTVAAPNPRAISVESGATAEVRFSISCLDPSLPELIAFDYESRAGNFDIFVSNVDGSGRIQLTDDPAVDVRPVWSPDGSQIAFVSNRDGALEAYIMDPDGSNVRRVRPGEVSASVSWAPDGTRLALRPSPSGIMLVDVDGSNPIVIYEGGVQNPFFSPDGSKLVFEGRDSGVNPFQIRVIQADGSGLAQLTESPFGSSFQADWSPDGSRLAYYTLRNGDREVHTMNPLGSDDTRLTFSPFQDLSPVWSRDGRSILFVSNREGNQELFVMESDGSAQMRLTDTPGNEGNPDWR